VIWQQISAPISPSSSGSPVFNSGGYVIGAAFSSLKGSDNQNLNFAIPSNYLMRLMLENNITPDVGTNLENRPRAALKRSNLFDKIKNHIKKSWYILKVKILRIKPKKD
jgi:V8-like Glu-specific endopeptidase